MSGTYGFGIIGRLTPDASDTERDELLLGFARLGLCPRFHEIVGDKVLRVECGAKEARLAWLPAAEGAPILAAARALGPDPASLVSAEDDRMMALSYYGDVLLPDYRPGEDDDAVELDMEDTALDGLRVGSVPAVLADLTAEARHTAGGDGGEAAEGDGPEHREALDEELAAEAAFERGLVAALRVCADHQLVLAWSPTGSDADVEDADQPGDDEG